MNRISLSITMMTIGIIIGITATHFKHVHEMANDDSATQDILKQSLVENHPDALKSLKYDIKRVSSSGKGEGVVIDPNLTEPNKKTQSAQSPDEVLLEILVAIRNEQKALRAQISESNRDIDELTFRVDTHSESFKPLDTLEDRPRVIDQAREKSDLGEGELLPPKP